MIRQIIGGADAAIIFQDCVNLIIYALVLLYSLSGYKTPHGNLLRGLFFAFGISLIVKVILPNPTGGLVYIFADFCTAVGALVVAYLAGRMDKIEKNKNLLFVAGIFLLAGIILTVMAVDFSILGLIGSCASIIVLAALGVSYTSRYEEHKTVGVENK